MIDNYCYIPIHSLSGELIALELTVLPHQNAPTAQNAENRLLDQLLTVERYADYFQLHGLLCCLTIDFPLARAVTESPFIQRILGQLPFVRLKLSEDFPNLHDGPNNPLLRALIDQLNILWLDDLGAGDANLNALQSKMFEVVKLDRQFYLDNISKPFFNVLIAHIHRYTNRVLVAGVESEGQLEKLAASKVWGVQGYFAESMALDALDGTEGP
ncbi:EAL domain-containing protein [Erwinia sp. BNK-24-b]|uniref:EAL domain-containing protein n=1 Tax=Erwinia TaxID=551 RepID=UPI001FEE3540|nr:EAL domain-containing protein [Erwinia phyllosphaerae]MBV4366428.1 EAL domain-containing protein [Erwinia phyllosphaerae]